MSASNQPQDLGEEVSLLRDAVAELQGRRLPDSDDGREPLIFSYPGVLSADVESPPYYSPTGETLIAVRVSLLAAASTDLEIALRVNGASIQLVTLPGGDATIVDATSIVLGSGDAFTVRTITVPADGVSLSAIFARA